jgi:hypothetical protein
LLEAILEKKHSFQMTTSDHRYSNDNHQTKDVEVDSGIIKTKDFSSNFENNSRITRIRNCLK